MALTLDADGYLGNGKPLMGFFDKADGIAFLAIKGTFDSSYPTGGETWDLRPYFSTLVGVVFDTPSLEYKLVYDYTNRKILAYYEDQTSGVHAQVANTTDLSAITFRAIAWGVAALDRT